LAGYAALGNASLVTFTFTSCPHFQNTHFYDETNMVPFLATGRDYVTIILELQGVSKIVRKLRDVIYGRSQRLAFVL
jgi:hypothetical protein